MRSVAGPVADVQGVAGAGEHALGRGIHHFAHGRIERNAGEAKTFVKYRHQDGPAADTEHALITIRKDDGTGAEIMVATEAAAEGDMDDDEFENQMSLAAIEAELKPKVVETFDKIADNYLRFIKVYDDAEASAEALRRVIGDLSDSEKVLLGLELRASFTRETASSSTGPVSASRPSRRTLPASADKNSSSAKSEPIPTVAQIQSHLYAQHYEGLIKKSKLRGGRNR